MNSTNQPVRVRIAPSPTGDPHMGTAYVALFNHAWAKKHNGKFILRIEDTDQARSTKESEQMIFDALNWLGLKYDEGPDVGGEYGPYRQSERKNIYHEHIQTLIKNERAYHCFCTSERLQALREKQRENKEKTGYDLHCRTLSPQEVADNLDQGLPHVVRLKMPQEGSTTFNDAIRGDITFENNTLDDQIILKGDGFPTYHLASVVDDHLMKITHVIRAEEWISSTPKHVLLYQAFGFDQPVWVHLPLLRNKDKSKISKRKHPVSINYYKQAGYLPAALLNFLCLMGFRPADDKEVFTADEFQQQLELDKISLGSPTFDFEKLNWLNGLYLRDLSDQAYLKNLNTYVFDPSYLEKIVPLVKERIEKFEDFLASNQFFFVGSLNYEGIDIKPQTKEKKEVVAALETLITRLDATFNWELEPLKTRFNEFREEIGWKPKDLFMMLRLLTTGRKDSPPLFETITVLGKELTRRRIREGMLYIKKHLG